MLVCIDRQFVRSSYAQLAVTEPPALGWFLLLKLLYESLTVSMVVIFAVRGSDCWSFSIMANRFVSLLMLVSHVLIEDEPCNMHSTLCSFQYQECC